MKILVMRFMGLGDVASILLPAVKLIKQQMPDAEVDVLTFGAGIELMQMMPEVHAVLGVTQEQWPGELLPAVQSFVGIGEVVLAQGYDRVINLDTWFMPCFLARLLKDVGINLEGNYINYPIAEFTQRLTTNQLTQTYFMGTNFLASSYRNMADWSTSWWLLPKNSVSYPHFYLNHCCGLAGELDFSLPVTLDAEFRAAAQGKPIIALSATGSARNKQYPRVEQLTQLLEQAGYLVWSQFDGSLPMATTLARLKASDLLVTVATSTQWLARLVGCPSLMISGSMPPSVLGAEINVPRLTECQFCGQNECLSGLDFACLDVAPSLILQHVQHYLATQ